MFLNGTLERARTKLRIVALLREERLGRRVEFQLEVLLLKPLRHPLQLDLHNLHQFLAAQAVENNRVIDAVQELRPEMRAQFQLHLLLHLGQFLARGISGVEILLDDRRADVARHDDDGVLEIHRPPLPVREASVVEHLEQHVEDIGVGFLNFIEEHDAIRPAAHGLAELPALLVAHVAGRCADEPRHGVLLHVFAHVDARHGVLVVEEEFRERPGQLRFTDTGRTKKNEGADGPVRILQSAPRAAHRVRHRLHRFLLTNDALGDALLHLHQLLPLTFEHLRHRNARP